MILAIDVHYEDELARISGVLFEDWNSSESKEELTSYLNNVVKYTPGLFYKRELPCILKLLEDHSLSPEIIVVDGFVYLDGTQKPGLGKYLHEALGETIAVIGVAKRRFNDIGDEYAIHRGNSKKPLYVTAVGYDVNTAKRDIKNMFGEHRIPVMLKRADQVCRGIHP